MTNFALGPSWLPKIGGLMCALAAALELVPFDAPGAAYIKPYAHALMSFGAALIGMTARQNNKSTEQATGKPVQPVVSSTETKTP